MICIGGRKTWSGVYVYIYFFIMSLGKAILRKIMYFIPDRRMDIEYKILGS